MTSTAKQIDLAADQIETASNQLGAFLTHLDARDRANEERGPSGDTRFSDRRHRAAFTTAEAAIEELAGARDAEMVWK